MRAFSTHIWCHASDSGENASVEREEPSFCLVHYDHRGPHPWELLLGRFFEIFEGGGLYG